MTRPHAGMALLALAALACAGPAAARPWVALGADVGTLRYDTRLADYQWDVTARGAWGAQLSAGLDRLALGARYSTDATTQHLGLDGVADPRVTATRLELVARARLVSVLGLDLAALVSGGRQRFAYHPGTLEIPTGGEPVAVTMAPVTGWVGGGGIAIAHALTGPWRMSATLERRWFALDTAHTAGGTVVDARETFGSWDARVGLDWLVTSR